MPHPKRQTAMKQPHDNWGTYYGFVYEQTFGSFYSNLITETLNVINQILTQGPILDFGAGTGRLSFPLAEQGYNVIAVEKSIGVANEFKIRYWEIGTIDKLLRQNGFNDTLKTFPQFNSTGSTYKLYKRQ